MPHSNLVSCPDRARCPQRWWLLWPSRWQRCPAAARRPNPPSSVATSAPRCAGELINRRRGRATAPGPCAGRPHMARHPRERRGIGAVLHRMGSSSTSRGRPPICSPGPGESAVSPGTLGPGTHIFAIDVTLTDGRHLTTAATAVVWAKARGIPRSGARRWTRKRSQRPRSPAPRDSAARRTGSPLPTGTSAGTGRRQRRGPLHRPRPRSRADRRPGALRARRAAGRRQ